MMTGSGLLVSITAWAKANSALAAAVHRQDLGVRVERRDAVAALDPGADSLTQRIAALGCGIIGQPVQIFSQRAADKVGRGMLRFADGKVDRAVIRVRRHAAEQVAQLLERVGVEQVEVGVHNFRDGNVSG